MQRRPGEARIGGGEQPEGLAAECEASSHQHPVAVVGDVEDRVVGQPRGAVEPAPAAVVGVVESRARGVDIGVGGEDPVGIRRIEGDGVAGSARLWRGQVDPALSPIRRPQHLRAHSNPDGGRIGRIDDHASDPVLRARKDELHPGFTVVDALPEIPGGTHVRRPVRCERDRVHRNPAQILIVHAPPGRAPVSRPVEPPSIRFPGPIPANTRSASVGDSATMSPSPPQRPRNSHAGVDEDDFNETRSGGALPQLRLNSAGRDTDAA